MLYCRKLKFRKFVNERKRSVYMKSSTFMDSWRKTNAKIASVFTIAILAGLPVVFYDYYFDILQIKYYFYCGSVIGMTVLIVIAALYYGIMDYRKFQLQHIRQLKKNFTIKGLCASDWAMLAFLAAALISTFQSEYFYESFWGNEGRYMGMFLILLYGSSYFIISRCLVYKRWYLDAFLGAGLIVCAVGILHFFRCDPIGFKTELTDRDYATFVSTIGNINTYTSYIALLSGMSVVLYAVETNTRRRLWYGINVIIALFALITGISDNAYLAMMALFGLLPLYLFDSIKGVKNYVLLLAVLFSEFQVIDLLAQSLPGQVMDINGLFNVIAAYSGLPLVTAGLWAAVAALHIIEIKAPADSCLKKKGSLGRWIWLGVTILVLLGGSYMLYDVNFNGNAERYGALQSYLVINDDWGTHRGYIWRIGMELYSEFPLMHKIFGYGPDTFGILTVNNYYEEMVQRYQEKFDSAHNEYLQYLITIGIAGLLSYLAVLAASIAAMIKKAKENPAVMAIPFALLCYGVQAAVNISVPIVAPVMLTLLMVGVASTRQ